MARSTMCEVLTEMIMRDWREETEIEGQSQVRDT